MKGFILKMVTATRYCVGGCLPPALIVIMWLAHHITWTTPGGHYNPHPQPTVTPHHGNTENGQAKALVDMCKNAKEPERPDTDHMNSTGFRVPDHAIIEDKFTVVMLTHNRDQILRKVLQWYGRMSRIDRIILYWNNPGRPPPDFHHELNLQVPLVTEQVNIKNLGDRFRPNPLIRTSGE